MVCVSDYSMAEVEARRPRQKVRDHGGLGGCGVGAELLLDLSHMLKV